MVSVNLGFNVGSEQGGLHYAIVLDNDNKKHSPVVTVVPLSSGQDEKNIYSRDIYLGSELYEKLKAKYDKLYTKIEQDLKEAKDINRIVQISLKIIEKNPDMISEKQKTIDLSSIIDQKIQDLITEKEILFNYHNEIQKLNRGSVALMEQITTVSKMRIYAPKNSNDLLYNIKYSDSAMNKINERLKELYIFSK